MYICRALLNHGPSNFSLEILAYCKEAECVKLEQEFLDLLTAEYNILQKAGNSLGYKHTEESKAKIAAALLGHQHSEETKLK